MKLARWLCFYLVAVFCTHGLMNAQDAEPFAFSRPIEIAETDPGELFSVPLDSEIYAATRDGIADLRVLDASKRLVPFLIGPIAETRTRHVQRNWTAANPVLKPLESNGMEIRISLAPDEPSPRGVRFITPLTNFEQQVRVWAVRDGVEDSLVDGALIFDYSQFMDVRRTEVTLPTTDAREFRIVVDLLTAEQESQLVELSRSLKGDTEEGRTEKTTILRRPFRIDRIEFWTELREEVPEARIVHPWPVSGMKVTQDAVKKETYVEFDSLREPLTSLKFVSSGRNFSRRAEIQIPADSKWATITESTISKFQLGEIHEEHLTIEIPETRSDRFRIIIKNGDSPEIPIDAVETSGTQHQVVFLRRPGQTVHLVYGSESSGVPEHDTAALSYALAQKVTPAATTLGPASRNSQASPKSFATKSLLNSPAVLGVVVVLLVIALGWGLYSASRRIDQMPRGDGE